MNMMKFLLTFIAMAIIVSSCPLYGQGISVNMKGRTILGQINFPEHRTASEGVVVVQIGVNQYGNVVEAIAGASGTTTTDNELWMAARKAAMQFHFNPDADAPDRQSGTVTFIFSKDGRIKCTKIKDIVETNDGGLFRVCGRYTETFNESRLIFGLEDENYIIPIRLVKDDLGAINRFRALNLQRGDTLVVEGGLSKVDIKYETYKGLIDAVIIDTRYAPHNAVPITEEFSQESAQPVIEEKPSFNGGDANEFSKWVNAHLVYPKIAKENGVQGRVNLQFTIKADGSVTNVKVLRGVDESLDKEAVRVVASSPKWKPAYSNGKPLDVIYTFPVCFGLR